MKFIIIGAGDVGTSLSTNLAAHQHEVVLIQDDVSIVAKEVAALDVHIVPGNGASPETLVRAGIDRADYVIAVTSNDEVNIAACFISRLINPKPKRIVRLKDLEIAHRHLPSELLAEYFDLIINPEQAAADYLMRLLRIPGANEIVEFESGRVRVLGLAVSPESPLVNVKLNTIKDWQKEMPILIVAVMRGTKLIVPKGDDKIRAGDIVYAAIIPDKTKLLFELVGKQMHETRTAMIWGDTILARMLARGLEKQGASVKLIVSNEETADQLASELKTVLVLRGEGTDQTLLLQESIADTDAFLAMTDDDENNVLGALLAKKLGARANAALVNKATYMPIVSAIGVDVVLSSRLAAASAIFKHIHSHSIISESPLQHEGGGFIEVDVTADMPLANQAIKDLGLPYGILIAAIVRNGDVTIPAGNDVVRPADRIVVFVLKSALRKLEKILRLKLELFA